MRHPRRRVRCWVCGHRARRVQHGEMAVVGRPRRVPTYGPCGADAPGGVPCREQLLLRRDVPYVLSAALEHERGGLNRTSEYDL